ncbi:mechanosensitive ion channel, partial [Candidatus Pacearchaeota archaeon]|nr:mechanosensitive ion channel [Candidatus Pacearchaeota archaeon]
MASQLIIQILISLGLILLGLIIYPIIAAVLYKKIPSGKIGKHRSVVLKRILNLSVWTAIIIAILVTWNVGLQNIWITITSFVALVAIGFFAVWSLLSNVIAGILIYLTKPFEIGNTIKILPEEIEGEVLEIRSFFIMIKDKKGNVINI